jgi:hypothetical protein
LPRGARNYSITGTKIVKRYEQRSMSNTITDITTDTTKTTQNYCENDDDDDDVMWKT